MSDVPTAPLCIVEGCERLSALSSVAQGKFWEFTTYYCSDCYEKLLEGIDVVIDTSRIIAVRRPRIPD